MIDTIKLLSNLPLKLHYINLFFFFFSFYFRQIYWCYRVKMCFETPSESPMAFACNPSNLLQYIQTQRALPPSLFNIQRSPGICCSWCGIDGFWAGVCLGPALEKLSRWGVVTLVIWQHFWTQQLPLLCSIFRELH